MSLTFFQGTKLIFGLGFNTADIVTDILISIKYFGSGDYGWGAATVAIVVFAGLFLLYAKQEGGEKITPREVVFSMLQLDIWRYTYESFQKKVYQDAIKGTKFAESVFEALPESVLQCYILFEIIFVKAHHSPDNIDFQLSQNILNLVSIVMGFASVSSMFAMVIDDDSHLRGIFFFLATFQIISRVFSFAYLTIALTSSLTRAMVLLVIALSILFGIRVGNVINEKNGDFYFIRERAGFAGSANNDIDAIFFGVISMFVSLSPDIEDLPTNKKGLYVFGFRTTENVMIAVAAHILFGMNHQHELGIPLLFIILGSIAVSVFLLFVLILLKNGCSNLKEGFFYFFVGALFFPPLCYFP